MKGSIKYHYYTISGQLPTTHERYRTSGTKYSRMDQVNFFKGCLPQILLGTFFNTLSQIIY